MKKIINTYFIIISFIVVLSIPTILAALNNEKFFYSDPVINFGLKLVDEDDNLSQKVQSKENQLLIEPLELHGSLDFEIKIREKEFKELKENTDKIDFLKIYIINENKKSTPSDNLIYVPNEFKEYQEFYDFSIDFSKTFNINLTQLGIYEGDGVIKDDILSLVFEFKTMFVKKGFLIQRNQITTTQKIVDFKIEQAGNRIVFNILGSREKQTDQVFTESIYKMLYREWNEFLNNSWEVKNG